MSGPTIGGHHRVTDSRAYRSQNQELEETIYVEVDGIDQ